jgi:hypothetical protein
MDETQETPQAPQQHPDAAQQTGQVDWDAYHAVIRLAAGAAGFGLDHLRMLEEGMGQSGVDADSLSEDLGADWATVAALLMGFVADLPDRVGRSARSVAQTTAPVRRLTAPLWRLTAATPVGSVAGSAASAAGEAIRSEAERLVKLGRVEYSTGLQLAGEVLDQTTNAFIDYLSASPALADLVSEQAMGVTGGAVREVRETGAAADGVTESFLRRVLKRPPRTTPPRPAFEVE